MIVRVIVDVAAVPAALDYVIPPKMAASTAAPVGLGARVRVPLHGRKVDGWIVEFPSSAVQGAHVLTVEKMLGYGPDAETLKLCEWAAHRWAGHRSTFLGTASPPKQIKKLQHESGSDIDHSPPSEVGASIEVLQLSPATSAGPTIARLVKLGALLVVAPTLVAVGELRRQCRELGIEPLVHPEDWATSASAQVPAPAEDRAPKVVIGTRSAAFARVGDLRSILVFDEHDSGHQNEGSPTWNARDVAVERARLLGIPLVLTSPVPSLEARALAEPTLQSKTVERHGWAALQVVDRRDDDLVRSGLYSRQLVDALRCEGRALCILNRTGRAALVACVKCSSLAECDRCGAAVGYPNGDMLVCRRCGTERPPVCLSCSSTSFRLINIGVTRAREELEALLREPVGEVTATTKRSKRPLERVLVGTDALLQRMTSASVVAFLEFDQELLAARYRSGEHALGLLAKASRIVGGRASGERSGEGNGGQVLVQTLMPESNVITAALTADPGVVAASELKKRELLAMPPAWTLAVVGGEGGAEFIDALGEHEGVSVEAATATDWMIRAKDRSVLLDLLASTPRPKQRLRLQVDPANLPPFTAPAEY